MAAGQVYRELGEAAWLWVLRQVREDDGPWLPEVVPEIGPPSAPGEDRDSVYRGSVAWPRYWPRSACPGQ